MTLLLLIVNLRFVNEVESGAQHDAIGDARCNSQPRRADIVGGKGGKGPNA